ncbi:hypothetical protein L7F22_067891 [Adiantum nelumboides]|nr:hypothetical protein [Adiantum nelumboides]
MNGAGYTRKQRMITRPPISCLPCRARKVKCDRQTQCGHCRRRGEECVWPTQKQSVQSRRPEDEKIQTIESRLAELESVIASLKTPQSVDGLGQKVVTNATPAPTTKRNDTSTQLWPDDVVDLDEFDHQIISTQRKRARRYSPVRSQLQESPNASTSNDLEHVSDERRSMQNAFGRLFRKLPTKTECDLLLERYWLAVEWIHHVVHRPSFERWLDNVRSDNFDQREEVFADMHTLALLYIMLCLSLHFAQDCSKEDHWQAQSYYNLSCKALEQGNYLDHHSVATIQTLVMQGIWLNDHGKSDRHHINLAMAIRIANVMGIGRQDIGKLESRDSQNHKLIPSDRSNHFDGVQEISRRLYWSLICQDCYTASSCNFTYTIHPSQVYIAQPANLNDEELDRTSDRPPPSLDEKLTEMSYHVVKIPFAILTRQSIDLFGGANIHFDDVIRLEKSIHKASEKLPESMKLKLADGRLEEEPRLDSRLEMQTLWQKIFLEIGNQYRILRIYRPFVIRGYSDSAYAYATRIALQNATSLLDLIRFSLQYHFPGVRWWVVRIQIFTAGVSCCVALHQQNSINILETQLQQFTTQQLRSYAQLALQLLNNGVENSPAAQRAISVLEALFKQAIGGVHTEASSTSPSVEQFEQHATTSPHDNLGDAHPLIPTIDWAALLGEAGGERDTLNDSRALTEVINAFGPNSWQL